jgi:3-oxoacid CoA-transferase B subunit
MKQRLIREAVAMRAAKEFQDGDYVNLGNGIPSMCASFIPEGRSVTFHAELGVLGFGPVLNEDEADRADFHLLNAGGQFVSFLPGICFFDHATSFGMVRGGHVDITVLGGLQVSENGDLANWSTTGELSDACPGGAFDMAVGAKKVIVTMEHTDRQNRPKVVKRCSFPLTARHCVDLIVTDLAVIQVKTDGLVLKEVAPGWDHEEVQALTEPELILSPDLGVIQL